ncbi:hypothetical protein [Rahnella sp. ChDrAdgB13]|uniref:hypothetical protein n=1 Tax=Rahnella sp. ChDrAdgB13 TaxID=1850581 RepID=UPI001AD88703|nr:hypothetical protein [Rahnella sp. ChDrAdgB13]
MKKTLLSEELQWKILDYLFDIHPRRLTDEEFSEQFGDLEDTRLVINIRQLMADDLVGRYSVIKTMTSERVFSSELKLTPSGLKFVSNNPAEN